MRFRKRPVIIDAMQHDGTGAGAIMLADWLCKIDPIALNTVSISVTGFAVETLEGTMRGSPGDWLIRGVNGEYYPCKPDIFEKTYEEVTDEGQV